MNLVTVVERYADDERVALRHRDNAISYSELVDTIRRAHAGVAARGLGPGDRIMLVIGTTPHFVVNLFGVLRAGAVAVPVNPLAPAPEMKSEINAVDPHLIIVGPAGAAALAKCDVTCPVVALPGAQFTGAVDFDDFLADGALPIVERESSDLALLLFTSGTAGLPKAAMLTHGNLQANIDQVDAHMPDIAGADDVALGVLPLFHILGLNMLLGVVLRSGASVVLVERFDPAGAIELIARHNVTLLSGPPAMWGAFANHPGASVADFETVRLALSGAAGLSRDVADSVRQRLGLSLTQGYGLTEAAPVLTLSVGTGAPATSVGRPVPGVQLRLVDSAGNDVPVGDKGEIWARGDNIFPGYWNDETATARALTTDGWLRTGDVAVVDDDGFLYIVDRSKDLIVVSGFNVFPAEVEAILQTHEAIEEAAVIGVAHALSGEAVKAYVVAVRGAVIDDDEVIGFCEGRLARYKCPQVIEVVDEIPKGGVVGKVRRRELR